MLRLRLLVLPKVLAWNWKRWNDVICDSTKRLNNLYIVVKPKSGRLIFKTFFHFSHKTRSPSLEMINPVERNKIYFLWGSYLTNYILWQTVGVVCARSVYLQGELGEKFNILGDDSIGHCEKEVHMHIYLILSGYWSRVVWIFRPTSAWFLFVGVNEERSLPTNTRWIDCSHFGCCWPHRETWSATKTKDTRSSYMFCKVHWFWRWDFKIFIVNCNKFVISV